MICDGGWGGGVVAKEKKESKEIAPVSCSR